MKRVVLVTLAVASMTVLPARADTETHRPPWGGHICTPLEVSVAHQDIVRTGGCTLANPLSQAGVASSNRAGSPCPSGHGACANVTPYWGYPTDSYTTPGPGTGRIDMVGSPNVCLDVGTRNGDATFGSGCGLRVTFTVPIRRTVVVTMRGPGIVEQLTYTFPA